MHGSTSGQDALVADSRSTTQSPGSHLCWVYCFDVVYAEFDSLVWLFIDGLASFFVFNFKFRGAIYATNCSSDASAGSGSDTLHSGGWKVMQAFWHSGSDFLLSVRFHLMVGHLSIASSEIQEPWVLLLQS